MNERIKELIEMADLCAASLMASGASEEEIQNRSKVVLAELIVRECAQFIFVLNAEPVSHKSAARMLQEHFGVE